jgi:hypothetical protein
MFAARIVDASVDVLGFPPDRIGLASVARLFGEVLPARMVIPRSVLEQVQQVSRAWVRWRTDARDLPRAPRRRLRRAANAVLTAFPALCLDRRLNPTVPHRNMITAIGQATYGTHARRIPAYSAVVEQLWNDRPAAVWQAARRLSATGLPRQQVLDRLAGAWQRHGPDTNPPGGDVPDDGTGFTDGYTAALQALGTAPAARGHR